MSWKEKKTNVWGLEKVGSGLTLRRDISNRKMGFFGHIRRHNCLERLLIQGKVEGKWRRGRPLKGWMDDLKARTGLTHCWRYQAYRWQKEVECSLGCHTCAHALMWSERGNKSNTMQQDVWMYKGGKNWKYPLMSLSHSTIVRRQFQMTVIYHYSKLSILWHSSVDIDKISLFPNSILM